MTENRKCPECGAPLPPNAPTGQCPACLLRIGLMVGGELLDDLEEVLPIPASSSATAKPKRVRYFGDYEIIEQAGHGGMGVVYQARQVSLNRLVALKMIRAGELANEAEVARFRAEAEAVANLDHPNIVPIYEVGEHDGRHYFSMKFVEGGSLAEALAGEKVGKRESDPTAAAANLPPAHLLTSPPANTIETASSRFQNAKDAALLIATIARAVHYAHQRGILHRDLKPGNILMTPDGEPQITDFGLAKRMETDSSLTLSGAILGTPSYIAPEQAAGSKVLTTATDTYSLGAILYELLTGRPPFHGATAVDTLMQVREREPKSPRLINPRVDRDLETICLKCLEKEPTRRYGSAEALAEDLERWLALEPIQARPVTMPERVLKWTQRKPAIAALIFIVLLVGLLGLAGIIWQWREAVAAKDAARESSNQRREQLWQSLGQQAHFARLSGQRGQRTNALAAIATAAEIRPTLELRNDALAALMLPDIGARLWWKDERSFLHPWCFDPTFEFYLPHAETGRVMVRKSGDHRIVADLAEAVPQPSAAIFSPDGRCVAIRFGTNEIRVWNWRDARLLAQVQCFEGSWGVRPFDFTPDSRALLFADTVLGVSRVNLDTGEIIPLVRMEPAAIVRVSPSGRRLAATRSKEVEVWELDPPRRLVITNLMELPGDLVGIAWHPSEELLALGPVHGVFLWHWGSGEIRDFAAPKVVEPYLPFFNATGDLLFLGGNVWDVASQTRLLDVGAQIGSVIALSRDERQIAFQRQRIGFGVWNFLPPLGTRTFLDHPLSSGSWLPQADVSSDGRRLVTTHADGWRVWNTATGRVQARGSGSGMNTVTYQAKFTADDKRIVTVDHNGLNRWPLPESQNWTSAAAVTVVAPETILGGIPNLPRPDTNQPLDPQLLALLNSSELIIEHGCVTRGGRFAALSGNGYVLVADLARTNFAALRLLNNDVEFSLSPDGRWLATGLHNRPVQDIWEVFTGKPFLQIRNPPFPACQFDPVTGDLVTWNETEFVLREPGNWREIRRFAWPKGSLMAGLLPGSVSPDGRTLWGNASDLNMSLLDAKTGHLVAHLERPGGFWAVAMVFDARGERAYICTSRNTVIALDIAALRRELARLGLDWPEDHPGESFSLRKP